MENLEDKIEQEFQKRMFGFLHDANRLSQGDHTIFVLACYFFKLQNPDLHTATTLLESIRQPYIETVKKTFGSKGHLDSRADGSKIDTTDQVNIANLQIDTLIEHLLKKEDATELEDWHLEDLIHNITERDRYYHDALRHGNNQYSLLLKIKAGEARWISPEINLLATLLQEYMGKNENNQSSKVGKKLVELTSLYPNLTARTSTLLPQDRTNKNESA